MPSPTPALPRPPDHVALFVTCLADQFLPGAAAATTAVLERLGLRVSFPSAQTCCGQPFLNDGLRNDARALAARFVRIFTPYDAIVTPSASCAAMVRESYPPLFDEPDARARAEAVAARTFELSEFLVRALGVVDVGATFAGRVALHPSCHAIRGVGSAACAEALVRAVRGIVWCPLPHADVCCGFGGVFSLKFPGVATALADDKIAALAASDADTLVSTDVSCLLHLTGRLARRGRALRTLHLAELLNARGEA